MSRIWLLLSICMVTPVLADTPPQATTAAVPAPATVAVTPPAPASVTSAAPALPTCQDIKAFKEKLHAVINAALRYPAELSFYPAQGVTIVGYDYQDGKVSGVRVTQASNDGRLDRTALRAVENADYASIKPGIGSLKLHDSVIIVFDNSANSEKNVAEQKRQQEPGQDDCG